MEPKVNTELRATPEEWRMVRKVQQEVGGYDDRSGAEELTALRYLRACKGNVDKAVKGVETYRAWREKEQVDSILTEHVDPKVDSVLSTSYAPKLLPGLDIKGRPVVYTKLGGVNMVYFRSCGLTMEQVVRRHTRELERMRLAVEASPCPELGHLLIFDLRGCTLAKFALGWQLWVKVAELGDKFYPELLGCICLVHAPVAAERSLTQIKKILDPVTASKIELHSSDMTLSALHALLTPAQVPLELQDPLAGTASDDGNKCDTVTVVDNQAGPVSTALDGFWGGINKVIGTESPIAPPNQRDEASAKCHDASKERKSFTIPPGETRGGTTRRQCTS